MMEIVPGSSRNHFGLMLRWPEGAKYAVNIKFGWRENLRPSTKYGYETFDTMVYYFTSSVVSPSAFLYVGKDKVESKLFSLD